MKETWFQSLSGLTLGLNIIRVARAATEKDEFQSLSGLTLGLNIIPVLVECEECEVSIPFRADTGFERRRREGLRCAFLRFNPFQG